LSPASSSLRIIVVVIAGRIAGENGNHRQGRIDTVTIKAFMDILPIPGLPVWCSHQVLKIIKPWSSGKNKPKTKSLAVVRRA
jgi:hypothetical protein